MVTFKHRDGRTVTAEPGTKRYQIFDRSRNWNATANRAPAYAPESNRLEDKTVAELQDVAERLGIEGTSKLKKAELVQAIAEKQAEE